MNKETPVSLTEWDWFKLRLKVYALERRAALSSFDFEFDKDDDYVVCEMHGSSIERVLKETTDKDELFGEYFSGWTLDIKREVAAVLKGLPVLGAEFDVDKNLVFDIVWDYGMGGSLVCRVRGAEVSWDEEVLSYFRGEIE